MHHIVLDRENGIYESTPKGLYARGKLPYETNRKGRAIVDPAFVWDASV
jgi:hypothetical protein